MKGLFFKTEKYSIPVVFDGRTIHVKNVTRYATCRDVIHKLLSELRLPMQPDEYKIFEVSSVSERALQDKDKIVKVMRCWGVKPHQFKFVLKNHHTCTRRSFPTRERFLGGSDDELEATTVDASGDLHTVIPITDCQSRVTAYLNERNLLKNGNENHKLGKLSVFRRFFTDLPLQNAESINSMRNKRIEPVSELSGVAGNKINYTRGAPTPKRRRVDGLVNRAITSVSDYETGTKNTRCDDFNLDVAFVVSHRNMLVDEGIDVDSDTSDTGDLDTAFIGHDDEDFGNCESRDGFLQMDRSRDLNNESHKDFVRKLFDFKIGGKRRLSVNSHDAELESFMNTRMYDSDIDEGVSSSGSDVIVTGKETYV